MHLTIQNIYYKADSIRAYLRESGQEINRDNLIQGGRKLRSQGGPGVLAEMLLKANENETNLSSQLVKIMEEKGILFFGGQLRKTVRSDFHSEHYNRITMC